jgi:hypothetical protein
VLLKAQLLDRKRIGEGAVNSVFFCPLSSPFSQGLFFSPYFSRFDAPALHAIGLSLPVPFALSMSVPHMSISCFSALWHCTPNVNPLRPLPLASVDFPPPEDPAEPTSVCGAGGKCGGEATHGADHQARVRTCGARNHRGHQPHAPSPGQGQGSGAAPPPRRVHVTPG